MGGGNHIGVWGPPRCLSGKEPTCNAGGLGLIPWFDPRSPGGANGNPLQHSCLENPMDRGAWRAAPHGVTDSDTPEPLSSHHARGHASLGFQSLTFSV